LEQPATFSDADGASCVTLTVLMPVYNERATLRELLDRVLASPVPKEVLIVDDASTDGTRELLRAEVEGRSPEVRVVYRDRNGGKGLAIRAGLRHLQDGGALLIYPSGIVDPDPDIAPGLAASINTWSGSLDIFLRRVPQTCVVPAIVSSVLSRRYFNNPLVRIPKTDWEKRKLAEMIQVSRQMMANKPIDLTPRLTFGESACGETLRDSAGHYRPAIIARAQQTLTEHSLTLSPSQRSLPGPAGTTP